jgi:hypothetical protein
MTLVAGAIQPAYSATTHTLELTEKSSTSLTATLDGADLTITTVGRDAWIVVMPAGDLLEPNLGYWHEQNPLLRLIW